MGATIETRRLRLVPSTVELARAEIADRGAFVALLGAEVPGSWPPEMLADALPFFLGQLEQSPGLAGWLGWYGLLRGEGGAPDTLVASGGFMGRPEGGTVEVGYSVLPDFQRRGIAGEMIAALVGWALAQDGVERVVAEIQRDNTPSLRLVRSLGFVEIGPGKEEGHLRFERGR